MNLDRFLASHDGVISRPQARACGLSDRHIRRRCARGEWLERAPDVFFVIAWEWSPAARVRVAGEWARPVGALGSITAAWWRGFGVATPHPSR